MNYKARTVSQLMHSYKSNPPSSGSRVSVMGVPGEVLLVEERALHKMQYGTHMQSPSRPPLPLFVIALGLEMAWYRCFLMAVELRAAHQAGKPATVFGVIGPLSDIGSASPFALYVTGVKYGKNKLHLPENVVNGLEKILSSPA